MVVDSNISGSSENPVQNKAIYNMIESGRSVITSNFQTIIIDSIDNAENYVAGETTLTAGDVVLLYE